MKRYRIYLDGGSSRNGTEESRGYGSYHFLNVDTGKSVIKRLEHGVGLTNNDAEWLTLVAVLNMLRGAESASVELFMDSDLVVKQFNLEWKCKNKRMLKYREESSAVVAQLEEKEVLVGLVWVNRDFMEMKVGH